MHPDLLVLVVSVRDGETEAYQQIHRVNPRQIDFKGPNARRDRLRLLLHRLFDNRMQVADAQITAAIESHVSEYLRLARVAPAEQERLHKEFVEAWPFAPHLMTLLEDQVLVATQAQETRDLMRILADVFKSRGAASPIITAAREVRYVIGGSDSVAKAFRVIVLAANWTLEPWASVEDSDLPAQWDDRIPLLVVPEPPDKVEARLGGWLKECLQTRRNAVRFLLPRDGSGNLFYERGRGVCPARRPGTRWT